MRSTNSCCRPVRDGRVALGIDAVVENGNTVPITVTVDSPMTAADLFPAIAANPQLALPLSDVKRGTLVVSLEGDNNLARRETGVVTVA
jgi:hypothetical protein